MADEHNIDLNSFVDRFLAAIDQRAKSAGSDELKALWRQIYPASSPNSDAGFSVFEEAFEAELRRVDLLPADLEFRLGGWTIDLRGGLVRAALSTALLGGVLFAAGVTGLAPAILPTVVPLLVDVRKVTIAPSDRKLLAELRTVTTDASTSSDELYARLPPSIRDSVSRLDFADYLDNLHRAGEVTVDEDEVTVHGPGESRFRISLD